MARLVVDIDKELKQKFEQALLKESVDRKQRISKTKKVEEWIISLVEEKLNLQPA